MTATFAFALLAATAHARAADTGLEARVKAAYIFNFLTFVEWDGDAGKPSTSSMKICVLGDDVLRPLLQDLSGRPVRGHPLQVAAASKASEAAGCHVLVIGRSESNRLEEVLRQVAGMPVLTVSDCPGFSRSGGMIGFVTEEGRVRIEINQRAATQAGLRIRAKLLEVARLVP